MDAVAIEEDMAWARLEAEHDQPKPISLAFAVYPDNMPHDLCMRIMMEPDPNVGWKLRDKE